MNREQIEAVIEDVHMVHHALAGMHSNLNLALEMMDMLSPTEKAQLEAYWQQTHHQAIQQLQASLACLAQGATTQE